MDGYEYDPNFEEFYILVCRGCQAKGQISTFLKHKEGCEEDVVYRFGERIARAILLVFLEADRIGESDQAGLNGFPFSWAELKEWFPQAAERAEEALSWFIEDRKEKEQARLRQREIGRLLAPKPMPQPQLQRKPPARQGNLFSDKTLVPRKVGYGGR